jgi:hypothetical protein
MLIYLQTAKIPGTAARGRGAMPSSMGRLTTGQAGGEMARPSITGMCLAELK